MRAEVSPSASRRAGDSGCPKDAEEGNAVSMRHKAYALRIRTRDRTNESEDASFARSFDPCTSILTTHPGRKLEMVGRAGEHHGWASSGNREEPTLGFSRTDVARLATHHRCRKAEGVMSLEKEEGRGLRPCEVREPGLGCPHVEVQLQKSLGDDWSRISSANALQKERPGSSEQGSSSERKSAGETVGGRVGRKEVASRSHR